MTVLTIHSAGPGLTVQDLGRDGWRAKGLARGGAADRLALLEAAALLGQTTPLSALEMAGMGGRFSVDAPTRFVLTGARMNASVEGRVVASNTSAVLAPGEVLDVRGAQAGSYGYLAFAGGVIGPEWLGSRSAHLLGGIGNFLNAGTIALGADPDVSAGLKRLAVADRLSGGVLRVMPGPQTELFDAAVRERFFATVFKRAAQANRQGLRLEFEGEAFTNETRDLASDFLTPGDVQMTGDGRPYVLLSECQTVGGYPRIGTVIAADLPKAAQAGAGAALRFEAISLVEADALWESEAMILARLEKAVEPLIRSPHDIANLHEYQLVDGATTGDELETE